MPPLRKWLILVHRYLGIPLSLLFVIWFASGVVMMYTGGMPRLTPEARLARLPDLDLSRVRLTAAEAVERAGLWAFPDSAVLLTVQDRPAWRFAWPFGDATVFADTGDLQAPLDDAAARAVAGRFAGVPEDRVRFAGEVTERDQWTIQYGGGPPYFKFEVDDGGGTELYVSPRSAEVTMRTTRRSAGARLGRRHPALVLRGRAAAQRCAVDRRGRLVRHPRLRRRRARPAARLPHAVPAGGGPSAAGPDEPGAPPAAGGRIPYTGWMRWHYLTGAGVRGVHAHVGVQRPVVDGAVRMDACARAGPAAGYVQRRTARSGVLRRGCRRRSGAVGGGARHARDRAAPHPRRAALPRAAGAGGGCGRRPGGAAAPAVLRHRPREPGPAARGGRDHDGPRRAVRRGRAAGARHRRRAGRARGRVGAAAGLRRLLLLAGRPHAAAGAAGQAGRSG